MKETALNLERNIKSRRVDDVPFVNWWLITLLINPITFGLAGIFFFIARIRRADAFIARKKEYYELVIEFSKKYGMNSGSAMTYPEAELYAMRNFTEDTFKKIKPVRWLLTSFLMIVTLGIYFFIYSYKMNRVWNDLQLAEADFYDKISRVWIREGLVSAPLVFGIDPSMKKSYIINLFLSVITLGLWLLVWDYQTHVAPEVFYPRVHAAEDFVLSMVKSEAGIVSAA